MSSKVLAYVMAKYEWPLLGLTISHVINIGADHVVVLDHASDDGSLEGLQEIQQHWPGKVTVLSSQSNRFLQEATGAMALSLFQAALFEWVYVFDADEFLLLPNSLSLPEYLDTLPNDVSVVRYQIDQWLAPPEIDESNLIEFAKVRSKAKPMVFIEMSGVECAEQITKGNLNYFDLEFPSKVIVRGHLSHLLAAGAHGVKSSRNLREYLAPVEKMRLGHLPLRSRAVLSRKARQGRQLIFDGFPSGHGWQQQMLAQLDEAGALDEFWSRHSDNPELLTVKPMQGGPLIEIDMALSQAISKAYKGLPTTLREKKLTPQKKFQKQKSIETLLSWESVTGAIWEQIKEQNALVQERDALVQERDALVQERDGLVQERDALVQERDGLVQERDNALERTRDLMSSWSWRTTKPLRWLLSMFRR